MSKRRPDLRLLWFSAFSAGFWGGFAIAALTDYPVNWNLGGILLAGAAGFGLLVARLYDGLVNEEEKKDHD